MTRKEAIKWLERIEQRYIINGDEGYDKDRKEALHMAIEILEYLDNIEAYMHDFDVTAEEATKALERKNGKWNETSESIGWEEVGCAECSVCGETFVLGDYTMDDIKLGFNYCPNCGARMDEDDDNDDN